jgi:DNA-binding NarL/FixJ family response regulator
MAMDRRPDARLLVADDHKLLAEACRSILEPQYHVVRIVTDGHALLEAAFTLRPDVIVLDIAMPGLNGLDAGEQIKRKLPLVKLVFLTMTSTAEMAAEAFRRGASAYVLKQTAAAELLIAIRNAIRGESYLSPLVPRDTVNYLLNQPKPSNKRITSRQNEVLQLLAEGMSMKEVAYKLNIKPGTVAFQKYRMMETLGVTTNAELLRYAIQHSLASA